MLAQIVPVLLLLSRFSIKNTKNAGHDRIYRHNRLPTDTMLCGPLFEFQETFPGGTSYRNNEQCTGSGWNETAQRSTINRVP